jgi:hypothetical protein
VRPLVSNSKKSRISVNNFCWNFPQQVHRESFRRSQDLHGSADEKGREWNL